MNAPARSADGRRLSTYVLPLPLPLILPLLLILILPLLLVTPCAWASTEFPAGSPASTITRATDAGGITCTMSASPATPSAAATAGAAATLLVATTPIAAATAGAAATPLVAATPNAAATAGAAATPFVAATPNAAATAGSTASGTLCASATWIGPGQVGSPCLPEGAHSPDIGTSGPSADHLAITRAPGAVMASVPPGVSPAASLASGEAAASGPVRPVSGVGTVDMLVLNALHPTMARFDFKKRAFLRIPFQLPPAERDALFARLREEAKRQEPAFQKALARLASQGADIARRRGEVLDALNTTAGPTGRLALEQELRRLQEAEFQIWAQQEEVECRRDRPEYTTAAETRSTLDEVEREVFEVIGEVAAREGVQVVLNANLPFPPADPATARISPMAQNRLAWLETDLYYSFLASSSADAAVYDPVADGAAADEWVKLIRHPAAAPFFPVRPYPLVLQGGTDLTGKVLAVLLERHHVDFRRATALIEAVGRLRRGN